MEIETGISVAIRSVIANPITKTSGTLWILNRLMTAMDSVLPITETMDMSSRVSPLSKNKWFSSGGGIDTEQFETLYWSCIVMFSSCEQLASREFKCSSRTVQLVVATALDTKAEQFSNSSIFKTPFICSATECALKLNDC